MKKYGLDRNHLTEGQIVWGCAYATNDNEKSLALSKKPVLGIVSLVGYGSFRELRKDGKPKATKVAVYSRHYAETEEESAKVYNALVLYQIEILQGLVDNCRKDLISDELN